MVVKAPADLVALFGVLAGLAAVAVATGVLGLGAGAAGVVTGALVVVGVPFVFRAAEAALFFIFIAQ